MKVWLFRLGGSPDQAPPFTEQKAKASQQGEETSVRLASAKLSKRGRKHAVILLSCGVYTFLSNFEIYRGKNDWVNSWETSWESQMSITLVSLHPDPFPPSSGPDFSPAPSYPSSWTFHVAEHKTCPRHCPSPVPHAHLCTCYLVLRPGHVTCYTVSLFTVSFSQTLCQAKHICPQCLERGQAHSRCSIH